MLLILQVIKIILLETAIAYENYENCPRILFLPDFSDIQFFPDQNANFPDNSLTLTFQVRWQPCKSHLNCLKHQVHGVYNIKE